MDRNNIENLRDYPYKVSWKADGTRYMMLIDGKDKVWRISLQRRHLGSCSSFYLLQIFFVDRDNCVFQVSNLTFLHRKMPHKHISDTLLDGVGRGQAAENSVGVSNC